MRQFWADVDAAWAEFRIVPQEFRELDREILVLGRAFARGRESGIAIEEAAAWIARLRQGRVVGFRSFSTRRRLSTPWGCGVGRAHPTSRGQREAFLSG
jgi:ketosteroid isomerase-like protein